MDSTPVNWEALDSLVIDFAKSENLIEEFFSSPSPLSSPSPSSSVSSSSYQSRLIIRQIRRCLEAGDIDSAIDLLRTHAPFVLDDHRLLFRLQKQKFIELLRSGTDEARDSAIECIRTTLAPCALDAYPEAYEEFKHVLLAFIYDKDDQSSPVANEWSERRRFDIAGLMSFVLRAHLHAFDPVFSMTLRYLISIHKGFCYRQGVSSPISDLTERLLLEEHDLPAVPQESLYEAPPFDEVDIQALAHAVALTRQGAVDSLRFAKGDLFLAFQNELCRMKLDVSMLDKLVHEYCVYRGVVDSGFASPSVSGMQNPSEALKVNQPEAGYCSSRTCSLEVDHATSKHSDLETSMCKAYMDGSTENNVDMNSTQGTDAEFRYAFESTSNCEDCSTSGSHQTGVSKVLRRNRNYVTGERSKRKRWRGRQDDQDYTSGDSFHECSKLDFNATATCTNMSREQQGFEKSFPLDRNNREDKYEIVLGMKELTSRGMAAEVVEEVHALDPHFFVQNHILLFQLKQVEFLKLVSSGDHSSALRVACSHLGPLAANDPTLVKPLKETLLALLHPNEDALGKGLPLNSLATSLQAAVGRRLGIEEPQLMKIMRAMLHTHNEWFKLQMCKDHFESLLRIDSLKEVNTPMLSACSMSKSNADSCTQGSSQVTVSSSTRLSGDGGSPTQVSSRDGVCDENEILKVMEFLGLPRIDAIHLLAQYNGNAETVIQEIFA
ncbi:hypothetical protein P3X46_018805 [Hevea brasiliensis]|uniref:CTLH domain-containing protein n=1 Tax=Hevea brasiliensis TaxID=3981 RepID=A0ABQ9LRT3_HEVBR|nr:uncharacterized protein LOC110668602 [Hevea brasiliensis]KAJ9170716.1 hypothetical protein P3X46_018805 [Hevea brasiliensis]